MNKNTIIFLFFLIALIILSRALFAADSANTITKSLSESSKTIKAENSYLSNELKSVENPTPIPNPDIGGTIIQLILWLLFVIGLIYVAILGLKFLYVKASIPFRTTGIIRVIAKEYLDNKSVLYVIEFANKILLLGNSGGTINNITEISDNEVINQIKENAQEYITKYRLKNESKFSQELKNSYFQQGQKIVDVGNKAVKDLLNKFKKSDKNGKK